ncbi:MAG: formyltransferase family protein [Weeksellaceae bacterium]
MMKDSIAVITYDYPHRKTQDVVFGLKALYDSEVTLLALPFVLREKRHQPIYKHRPSDAYPVFPEDLAHNFGFSYRKVEKDNLSKILSEINPTATLIAGAGILPENVVNEFPIINSHPAYLPDVRGLDALKWAIYYQKKIGVTSHIVNARADAGKLINRVEVPIFEQDTFHAIAYRQYRIEIDLLIESIQTLKTKDIKELPALEEIGEVHRRMPSSIEKDLLSYFEIYKKNYCKENSVQ